MSKRREESTGRREGPTGGAGRPDSANKFYSKFNKDAERRDDFRGEERRERSFDKPRGERSPDTRRPFDNNRSRNDAPRGGRFEGGGPRREFDRPRESRDDNREPRRDNDRFRRDDNRDNQSKRFEGAGGRRDFGGSRSNRDEDRGFRRDDRDSGDRGNAGRPRFERNDDRGERSGRFEGGGPRREFDRPRESRDGNREPRRDNDRFRRDDSRESRGNRFGNSESREDRFGGERSYGDRSRNTDARSDRRDNRFGSERSYSDRSDRSRDTGSRERPSFERPRRDDRSSRDERPSQFGRSRRDEGDETFRRKVEDSRERQVGRSQAPEYDLDKMKAKAFGGRDSRDKKGKKPGRAQAGNRGRSESASHEEESGLIRLNRYIANSGICSRRDADELIAQGDVSVNGKVVTEMGYKVQPTDVVKYGTRVLNPEKMTYVLLNKPKDYITTTDDPNDRNTVMDLVAGATPYRIYPVGRLDRNTTGLLLLTNDGELAEKLTHPSNEVKKVYQVEIDKPITDEHFEAIRAGFELEDGFVKPDDLGIVTPDAQVIGIEIHSGRNRIVRRIFEHFGYEVTKLDRTVYAGLTKKELPRGSWRYLDEKEVIRLKFLL
ncbi:pseudouridine synthase [Larkinella arboricola]